MLLLLLPPTTYFTCQAIHIMMSLCVYSSFGCSFCKRFRYICDNDIHFGWLGSILLRKIHWKCSMRFHHEYRAKLNFYLGTFTPICSKCMLNNFKKAVNFCDSFFFFEKPCLDQVSRRTGFYISNMKFVVDETCIPQGKATCCESIGFTFVKQLVSQMNWFSYKFNLFINFSVFYGQPDQAQSQICMFGKI